MGKAVLLLLQRSHKIKSMIIDQNNFGCLIFSKPLFFKNTLIKKKKKVKKGQKIPQDKIYMLGIRAIVPQYRLIFPDWQIH